MTDYLLKQPQRDDIGQIIQWIKTKEELFSWGGPNMRWPIELDSFCDDIKLNELQSYSLFEQGLLVGFGQFYQRLNHAHLGRIIVNPDYRGKGYGKVLIEKLCQASKQQLQLNSNSLFVLNDNTAAKSLYAKLGFRKKAYPEPIPIPNCVFMIKN